MGGEQVSLHLLWFLLSMRWHGIHNCGRKRWSPTPANDKRKTEWVETKDEKSEKISVKKKNKEDAIPWADGRIKS